MMRRHLSGPRALRLGLSSAAVALALLPASCDNAEVGAFWNKSFEKAGYPPGYRPIQHGEAGGTAANFKPAGEKFDPSMDVRKQVWEPGDTWDSERLVVAAQADNIGGVGLAESWGKMDAFHAANPMGQFRFSRPGK